MLILSNQDPASRRYTVITLDFLLITIQRMFISVRLLISVKVKQLNTQLSDGQEIYQTLKFLTQVPQYPIICLKNQNHSNLFLWQIGHIYVTSVPNINHWMIASIIYYEQTITSGHYLSMVTLPMICNPIMAVTMKIL